MNSIILFLYRESVGELNVALPFIKELALKLNISEIYFHITSQEKYIRIDTTYQDIMSEIGTVSIGNLSFLRINLQFKNTHITIITTDKCPEFELAQLQKNFSNSTTILMHHAQSILYNPTDTLLKTKKHSIHTIYKPDFFLVGNKIDFSNQYFSKSIHYHIPLNKIILIGALNYSKHWLEYLNTKDNSNLEFLLKTKQTYKKTILVTTRAPHKEYLNEEDYEYQVKSILNICVLFPNYLFILKPHPREKTKIYEKVLLENRIKNLLISHLNAYKLCMLSDLVISFWSSVIQDCAITNTPVIEFHRHNAKNSNLLIFDEGRLKSFFEYYGFCKYTNNQEDLIELLKEESNDTLFKKQLKNIEDIFILKNEEINSELNKILEFNQTQILMNTSKYSSLKIVYEFIRDKIILYINKKQKKYQK